MANKKPMKRRGFLKAAGATVAAAAAVSSFPAPAISEGHKEWIACSAFGKTGILGDALSQFAAFVNSQSSKVKIKVYFSGELVPGL